VNVTALVVLVAVVLVAVVPVEVAVVGVVAVLPIGRLAGGVTVEPEPRVTR
jgi:hypothetical protein